VCVIACLVVGVENGVILPSHGFIETSERIVWPAGTLIGPGEPGQITGRCRPAGIDRGIGPLQEGDQPGHRADVLVVVPDHGSQWMSRAATQEAQISLWDLPAVDIVMALKV